LFRRACRPSVLIVSEEGEVHYCEVALVVDLTLENGGDSPLADEGEL